MANKRLLSLLFLISITNLFWTNAEVTTCYSGEYFKYGNPLLTIATCPTDANYACFFEASMINEREKRRFGCSSESDCKVKGNGYQCCLRDKCNCKTYNQNVPNSCGL